MNIAVVNQSKRLLNADVSTMTQACALQAAQHFAPAWEITTPVVRFFEDVNSVPSDYFIILILDTPDQDGALGYHSEQGDKIFGRIFVSPVLDNGGVVLNDSTNPQNVSVASVLSHEICELVCDPFVDYWVDGPEIDQGSCYALEVCDPVQGDSYVIPVGQIPVSVSNFVLPAWFDDQAKPGTKVDYLGKAQAPFTMTDGGYMVVRECPGEEQQVLGRSFQQWRAKKHAKARSNKRMTQ